MTDLAKVCCYSLDEVDCYGISLGNVGNRWCDDRQGEERETGEERLHCDWRLLEDWWRGCVNECQQLIVNITIWIYANCLERGSGGSGQKGNGRIPLYRLAITNIGVFCFRLHWTRRMSWRIFLGRHRELANLTMRSLMRSWKSTELCCFGLLNFKAYTNWSCALPIFLFRSA